MVILVNVCHCLNRKSCCLLFFLIIRLRSTRDEIFSMVFKRRKRPEISKPTNFQHIRKTYFDVHSQTLKDLPPQWTSILTDEDITRTAISAYEKQRQHQHPHHPPYLHQQARPKPFIGDACFLTPSDLEYLKSQTIVRGSTAAATASQSNNVSPAKNVEEFQPYPSSTLPISRNHHLDRLYNVKTPDPTTDNPFPMLRKPSVPTYQNDLILPSNGKVKPPVAASPVPVTPRDKIDGSTKLSLEDVR